MCVCVSVCVWLCVGANYWQFKTKWTKLLRESYSKLFKNIIHLDCIQYCVSCCNNIWIDIQMFYWYQDHNFSCCNFCSYNSTINKIYREKSIPMTALWCPVFSNHGWLYHSGNTTAYYSYYFDYLSYLLSLPFKGHCRTLGIYFR